VNSVAPVLRRMHGAYAGELGKRVLDVVLASCAIVLLSPALLVATVLVASSGPGPLLFHQARVGIRGREFRMWKFRTMVPDADDAIHRRYVTAMLTEDRSDVAPDRTRLQKLEHDPRVTKHGAFLRRWSLDELPQLFNVLTGSMSLVGPRPVLPWEADLIDARYRRRFEVKPGMTGLWQVSGRSSLTMVEALDIDVEYVTTRSFGLDVAILLRTIPAVLASRSAS